MKHYLEKLFKLSSRELEKELGRNKDYPVGGYVISPNAELLPEKLGKIIHRDKYNLLLNLGKNTDGRVAYSNNAIGSWLPLTLDNYKKAQKRNLGSTLTMHSVWNFYKKEIYTLYGEENVDYVEEYSNRGKLTIKFPTLTIRNEYGLERTLQDVYCIHALSIHNGKISKSLSIFRATATVAEYVSEYFLSHVNGILGSLASTGNFCMGKDPLREYSGSIKVTDLLYYLLLVENFISSESEKGIPFKYLSHIKDYKVKDSEYVNLVDFDNAVFADILKYIGNFEYSYDAEKNKIEIETSSIEPSVRQYLIDTNKKGCLGIYVGDSHGIPIPHKKAESYNIRNSASIKFKGDTIPFSIVDSPLTIDTFTSKQLVANPTITRDITRALEKEASKIITNHLLNKYD